MAIKIELARFATLFAKGEWDIGNLEGIQLNIPLWSNKPIKCNPYHLSPEQAAEVHRQCTQMLKIGVIAYSSSSYAAPVIVRPKKILVNGVCVPIIADLTPSWKVMNFHYQI